MQKQHAFQDTNKTLVLSHKDHGGARIRIVKHNHPQSEVIDFHLTKDELAEFKKAIYDDYNPYKGGTVMFNVDELLEYLNNERKYNYAAAGNSSTKSVKDYHKTKTNVYSAVINKIARMNNGKA